MRKLLLLLAVGLLALATTAAAQGAQLRIRMGFPAILPPLVEIQPGVRVVQDFDEEIFFTGGYYWAQRDGNWYRARDHRGTWSYVKPERLPPTLARNEPGHYRHWQHDEGRAWPDAQHARGDARHWKPADYRNRNQPQEEHQRGPSRRGDRNDADRRDREHDRH